MTGALTVDDRLLVDAAEACRLLGISDRELRRLVAEGLIDIRYIGVRRRFPVASLRAFVAGLPSEPMPRRRVS